MAHKRDEIADLLRQRIVAGLHLGTVREGERLPSVRVLAAEVGADPRVVLAAYRKLSEEGLVEVRPKSGVYVATVSGADADPLPQLAEWVVGVLVQGLGRGVAPPDLPERVRRCLETVAFRTACIECNLDQIGGLCRELERDYGLETTGVDLDDLSVESPPESVRSADLLVTTSFHAARVQEVALALGKPWIAVHLRGDFLAEVSRFLAAGPVYFVATDPRFADKLRVIFSAAPGAENLRALIVGRDDLSGIPGDAPTYVMPSARARVEGMALSSRPIPAPRVFSEASAREILTFIVRANMAAERLRAGSAGNVEGG